MKKVKFLLLCLLAGNLTGAFAQVKFGVKGGVNLTSVSFKQGHYSEKNKAGFFIGPTALVPLPVKGVALDASILFDQRGVSVSSPGLTGSRIYETTVTHRQFIVPINARYQLELSSQIGLLFLAGPQLGITVGQKEKELDYGDWVEKKCTFSINAGLGLMLFQHLQLAANYNIACSKSSEIWINRIWGIGEEVNSAHMNAWQISVSYYW